jgi:hypothetical protein
VTGSGHQKEDAPMTRTDSHCLEMFQTTKASGFQVFSKAN